MRIWAAIFILIISLFAFSASADDATDISISASLSKDGSFLTGTVKINIKNTTGQTLEAVPLWLYANRFKSLDSALTDRNVNWIYPSGFYPGGIELSDLYWNGKAIKDSSVSLSAMAPVGGSPKKENVIAIVPLPNPLKQGGKGVLTAQFTVAIPKRRGRFGFFDGTVSLGGGWFPRPFTDLTGKDSSLPPASVNINILVDLPAGRGAVINDRVFPWMDKPQTLTALNIEADTITLVVMDKMNVVEQRFSFGKGVYVSSDLMPTQPTWSDTRGKSEHGLPKGLRSLGRINFAKRALNVLKTIASLMQDAAPDCPLPKTVVMVEIPAWDRLVQTGSNSILVSNRLWRLIPFERVLSFHDQALAKIIAEQLSSRAVVSLEGKTSPHTHLISEVIGAHYGDKFALQTHYGSEDMSDVIGFAAFIPYVDSLLYAPQIPFREAYSRSIEEEDALRDEPWRFMNNLPRGRRIEAKFLDLNGPDATDCVLDDYLNGKDSFDALIDRELGEGATLFRRQWYGDYPKINYAIDSVKDTLRPDGLIAHRVMLRRDGAEIIEPVTVRIIDRNGESHDIQWLSDSSRGSVEWASKASVDKVLLDPDGRLVENADLIEDHPSADNLSPLPWRPPMLTRVLLWGDAITMEPFVDVGLAMRRRYDVTNSFYLNGSYTPRSYGGSVSYARHFGPKRTLNSRTWFVAPSLSITRQQKVDSAGSVVPDSYLFAATMGSLGLMLGRDDRTYFFDPRSGWSFRTWANYSTGRSDDGRAIHLGKANGRLFGLWSPVLGHTFAFYGGVMGLVGDPPAANLNSFSDRSVLRGFALDETYGRLGLYAVLEYRHNFFSATAITTPFFNTFDRLQGVLFAGVGTMSKPTGYDGLFTEKRVFVEVGYGLRLHILTFGISQYLLGLDFAFPVSPSDRSYQVMQADGSTAEANRNAFKLVFGITQTY